jgi:hypothetical protein
MTHKFVVAMNRKYQADQLLSALGHVSAGMAANAERKEAMDFVTYRDADGGTYPNISAWPFIVLKGNGGALKRLRSELIDHGIDYACYLDTMISGGSDAQRQATNDRKSEDIKILAIAMFGDAEQIDPLTKKFSLWRAAE